jgi:6-phosphofructokinase 2
MSHEVVTLTLNPSVDKSSTVDNVMAEKKLRCAEPEYEPGGGGLNVARALHKMGRASLALYLAGGPTGDTLDMLLTREGINHRPVRTSGWTRENLAVFEISSGQLYRFGMPGPRAADAEWTSLLAELDQMEPAPRVVVASGSLPPGVPPDFYARLSRRLRERDTRLVLDTSGEPLRAAVEEGVSALKMNLAELTQWAGQNIIGNADIEDAARGLIERGKAELVVVSLGAQGAAFATARSYERIMSPTVPVQSTVGAGDSMVAGLVHAWLVGRPFHEVVRYGVAAGTAAVMTPGSELCRLEDVDKLFGILMAEKTPM